MRLNVMLDAENPGHLQDYIRSMCNVVTCNLEWRVCVLNWRGFNDAPISKSKVYYPVICTRSKIEVYNPVACTVH